MPYHRRSVSNVTKIKRRTKGQIAEKAACEYLEQRGYKLLEKNFQRLDGEIDIIMEDGETVVFVEVRSRVFDEQIKPEDSLENSKMSQVVRLAELYMYIRKIYGSARIDAVCVDLDRSGSVLSIRHYPNANRWG